MTKIIVDHVTGAKFATVFDRSEIRNETGQLLGYFWPNQAALYEGTEPPESAEELDRIDREGGGRPLKDILRDLEKRA